MAQQSSKVKAVMAFISEQDMSAEEMGELQGILFLRSVQKALQEGLDS